MKKSGLERRVHPRLQQNLPFKVAANGYDFSTTTENISCLGAYCQINKYIPPFTRVSIKLTLPIRAKESDKHCTIDCQGTIVRTEDKDKDNFNIAIFFSRINNSQRKIITEYINQFLPQDPARAASPGKRWGK
ncbi:MAG: PilZ domain-containing protein [Candidatus Omnitrophota bacterium]|nr:PilZ domain-containing protein [Candidatus Omnitrophota bacterium]